MSNFTIMQFSDLHTERNTFQNPHSFVTSILSDVSKYKIGEIQISKPNLLIVCGDIIDGISNCEDIEESNYKLENQYDEAYEILKNLCEKLFDNNPENIIIVPGNHDISWTHSKKSMEKLDKKDKELYQLSQRPDSNIRWNWEDFSFYQINNLELYNKRILTFSKFYEKFYKNRKYSLNFNEQFDIFEYPNTRIIFVGYNSCYLNDHLNPLGMINPECIAKSYDYISQDKYDSWLKIAVWHHDIYGGHPSRANYMDERTVQFLIDKGFHIGLHGHLHKTKAFEMKLSEDCKLSMILLGTGSLGASNKHIPIGESNQYSIIEISKSFERIRQHLRKSMDQPQGLTIWMQGYMSYSFGKAYIDIDITGLMSKTLSMTTDSKSFRDFLEIEKLMSIKEFAVAIEKLKLLDANDPFVRRLLLECYIKLDLDEELISLIKKPKTLEEFIYLTNALWRVNNLDKIGDLIKFFENDINYTNSRHYQIMKEKLSDRGYVWKK